MQGLEQRDVLRATDKGTPPLARYKRVIVTVVPAQ